MNPIKLKIAVAAMALSGLGMLGGALTANAYQGNPDKRAPWFSQERYDAIQKAIEDKDYDKWKELMEEQMKAHQEYMFSKITADNFEKFAEMRQLMKDGKFKEANEIRKDLGLNGFGHYRMMGRNWGHGGCRGGNNR